MNPNQPSPSEIPQCELQVSSQISLIEQEIRDNDGIVKDLNERLSCIIAPYPEAPDGQRQPPEEMLVPLAARLRFCFKSLRMQNIELRAILAGVQL